MRRALAAAAAAAFALVPAGAATAGPVSPGGQCDGTVDVFCRTHVCQPDELDCGMIPPCFVYAAGACRF